MARLPFPPHQLGRFRPNRRDLLAAAVCCLAGCGDDGKSARVLSGSAPVPAPAATAAVTSNMAVPADNMTADPTASSLPLSGVVVQAGDSIGAGQAANGYVALDHLGLGDRVAIHNVSVSGRTMAEGYQLSGTELFPLRDAARPSVLMIEQGTNDLGAHAQSAASVYQQITLPFVASAQAAGFLVVVHTLLPRADGDWSPQKEVQRGIYNQLVRTNRAGANAINDWAADPLMGDGVDTRTSPYYADALHPTLLGQQRLAVLDAAVLLPVLQRASNGR